MEAAEPHRGGGPAHETSTAIAVLLALAAVLAAAISARAAFLADVGSDKWHEAVRTEIKYGAGLLEDTRFVYQEVAPQAFQVISATVQAQELERQARRAPAVRALLAGEAGAQRRLANSTAQATGIAKERQYLKPGPTYDVTRKLADTRNRHPDLVKLDSAEVEHEGSELKRQSTLLFAAGVPAGFAFLAGAMAHGFGTWRRWLLPLGFTLCGVAFVLALIVEFSF